MSRVRKIPKPKLDQPEAPEGKIVDFIDGKLRADSETEQVRQDFERTLIEEYRYERADIGVDVRLRVQDGSRVAQKKASLIVFQPDAAEKDQNSAHVIIQIVRPGTQPSDSKTGAAELERMMIACPTGRFGCWSNGTETVYFQKKKQKFDMEIFPVNDFPRKGEDDSAIFTTDRSRLRVATGNNLLAAFRRCHDFIHANQGGSKEQIFWEFLKILFAKIEDEQDEGRPRFAIRNADERNTRTGQQEVKDRVEVLFRNVKNRKEYKGLFDDAVEGIRFNPDVVAYVVAQLEKYDFLRSSVDVKGMAYETIVGPTLEGVKGEFFTLRTVVKMTVKMLDPNPGDRMLDDACGTGGFIVVAFNYVSEKIRQAERKTWKNPKAPTSAEEKDLFRKIHEAGKSIFGLDFNANLVKTAQMNMVMNNDGRGGLFCVNSLLKPSAWPKAVQQAIELGSMDIVMTNPPFGTKIKIEGQDILDQYDLAHVWRKENGKWVMDGALRNAMSPEILFIERCVQFLKPGKGKIGHKWGQKPSTFLQTDYEKLLTFLFTDEFEKSTKYRQQARSPSNRPDPPETRLDIIKRIWESVLPHGELLIGGGKIDVKARSGTGSTYPAADLSDGERVIFYLIGQTLAAKQDGIVVIDEPELHLHRSLQARLWDAIEAERPDCLFVYFTHDLDFAASRATATKIWLRAYEKDRWDWHVLPPEQNLPERLLLEILGSRKPILFVEGERDSLDHFVFSRLYPSHSVTPCGGASAVIHATCSFASLKHFHNLECSGLVDRDFRSDDEISYLSQLNVFVPDVSEVENLLLQEGVLRAVAPALHHQDVDAVVAEVKRIVFGQMSTQKERLASQIVNARIDRKLKNFEGNGQGATSIVRSFADLIGAIDIPALYGNIMQQIDDILAHADYEAALRVFNHKGLLPQIANVFGFKSNELLSYVRRLLASKDNAQLLQALRAAAPKL